MSLATKHLYVIFNKKLYKYVDGVAMGSTLHSTLANYFVVSVEKGWLQNFQLAFKLHYELHSADDIFVSFTSPKHLAFSKFNK